MGFELTIVEAGKPTYEWRFIASCGLPDEEDNDFTLEEVEANARLIAAAPDLLDGCNALLGLLQLLSHRDDISDDVREFLTKGHRIDEAEAAVAKATGGES
jgi:hypothetical protein